MEIPQQSVWHSFPKGCGLCLTHKNPGGGLIKPLHHALNEQIDPKLNLTFNKAQKREVKIAMSNTFGFGGHNACILFKKFED